MIETKPSIDLCQAAPSVRLDESTRPAGNPSWYPGMKSPNPTGRPKGTTPQAKFMQRILADADGIIDAVVTKALEGDVGAGALLLNRLIPALKAQAATVEFSFDPSAPASKQVEAILSAISSGAVSPDIGRQVIDAIGALSTVRASEELEARIEALEAARLA